MCLFILHPSAFILRAGLCSSWRSVKPSSKNIEVVDERFDSFATQVLLPYCGKDQALFRCPGDHISAEDVANAQTDFGGQGIGPDDVGKSFYDAPPSGKGTKLSYDYPQAKFVNVAVNPPPDTTVKLIGKTRVEVLKSKSGKMLSSTTIQIMYDYEAFHGPRGEAVGSQNFVYLDGHVDDQ
jgi:prepilin-type processing-associated H-X9-DG protein